MCYFHSFCENKQAVWKYQYCKILIRKEVLHSESPHQKIQIDLVFPRKENSST